MKILKRCITICKKKELFGALFLCLYIIYRILRLLEKAMDCEEFDRRAISAEALSLSEARRTANLKMLVENGYVQGLDVHKGPQGNVTISMHRPEITLKRLEYP